MDENEDGRLENLIQDYFDSEIRKTPGLRYPDWNLSEKPAKKQPSWIPSLVFNLVLAVLMVCSIPLVRNREPELVKRIEVLNDMYKIDEHIIDGVYSLSKHFQ